MIRKNLGVRIGGIALAVTLLVVAGYALRPKEEKFPDTSALLVSVWTQHGLEASAQMACFKKNPSWQDLNAAQRDALSPLAKAWNTLHAERKQKWLHVTQKFFAMKPEQQQRAQDRMRAWANLSPVQRDIARENYAQAVQIDAHEKALLWEQYQQLPYEKKQQLAKANKAKKRITNLPSAQELEALEARGVPSFKSGLKNDRSMTAQVLPSKSKESAD
ncbi:MULTISPECIES: DUF3106 domain-containing protein [unclassified Undibacterium]|nr:MULTISPECIES: DUF3106 domain-containing protein [unclassified Undibacterium]MEB0217066.1 DUF3106 domain-containing protein [Undibacterium sp. 5I2]WPX44576.1 DUF3106 domain-containing protein [Undibacterium sp. CCC3.4]